MMVRIAWRCLLIDDPVNMSESVSSTSLSLLERAKANDETAWERLRDLYAPLVYCWCRRAGVSESDVADVGQDVFVSVAENLVSFRRDRPGDTFRGWLRTITRNKIADLRRRHGHEPQAVGGSDAQRLAADMPFPTVDAGCEPSCDDELNLLYARAIEIIGNEFPEWYSAAFLRVVVEGHHPADVAADLGRRTSAVYNVKSRILRRLRMEFAEAME